MTLSLRQLARSRRLRALGVLAWLMLVVNAVVAAPMGMHAMAGADAMMATPAVVVVHCHDSSAVRQVVESDTGCAVRADCCIGITGDQCSCAAMCAAALAPLPAGQMAPLGYVATYPVPRLLDAPALAAAPPLRPPAV
ncbi:MAG: hypothetical protein EPN40_13030 [Rhodanobacteraceae bacterium]|nr:MAG: hypothetical protein EPN40_13030 [Rhodanobacteraceae bacterium]